MRATINRAIIWVLSRHIGLYYWWFGRRQLKVLLANLRKPDAATKTTQDSKALYEAYDDREQREYEDGSRLCIHRKKVRRLPEKEIRQAYLEYLYREIEPLMSAVGDRPLSILEVGCGNCINLVNVKSRYGDAVDLHGIDISGQRLAVAREHFGDALDGVHLEQRSATDGFPDWDDGRFDLVFSMHCLEQIPYKCESAVREMYRLAGRAIVMLEPVFELGNPAQRLYLINSDHNRILLKSLHELGYEIAKLEPLEIQSNPLNQSSLILIRKDADG